MIKCLIIDRDGVCVHHSSDPASPFYYILRPEDLVLKPNVREAFSLLSVLRRSTGLKVYLATKQRCIGKGLVTRPQVNHINERLEGLIGFRFDAIYVEESAPDKRALYAAILKDSGARPDETYLIDDSYEELNAAWTLGILPQPTLAHAGSLYDHVCRLFSIS